MKLPNKSIKKNCQKFDIANHPDFGLQKKGITLFLPERTGTAAGGIVVASESSGSWQQHSGRQQAANPNPPYKIHSCCGLLSCYS
jgi:hypothetical protein